MQITYTKEGVKITHPTGVSQLLTLEDLNRLYIKAKEREKKAAQTAQKKHDNIKRVEALQ